MQIFARIFGNTFHTVFSTFEPLPGMFVSGKVVAAVDMLVPGLLEDCSDNVYPAGTVQAKIEG